MKLFANLRLLLVAATVAVLCNSCQHRDRALSVRDLSAAEPAHSFVYFEHAGSESDKPFFPFFLAESGSARDDLLAELPKGPRAAPLVIEMPSADLDVVLACAVS